MEKVHFTRLTGHNLNFQAVFFDLQLSKHTHKGVATKNQAVYLIFILSKYKSEILQKKGLSTHGT